MVDWVAISRTSRSTESKSDENCVVTTQKIDLLALQSSWAAKFPSRIVCLRIFKNILNWILKDICTVFRVLLHSAICIEHYASAPLPDSALDRN